MTDEFSAPLGKVIWHDLMTTDLSASLGFHQELFGWSVREIDMPTGKYHMLSSGGKDVGGMIPLDRSHGIPSHWIAYVAVDDLAACLERAGRSGGETVVPPMDIPGVGAFAVVKDPAGGFISPFRMSKPAEPEAQGPPPHGSFCWDELLTHDAAASRAFYTELFGWVAAEIDVGPMGNYTVLKRGEKDTAGILQKPEDAPPGAQWLSYVFVASVDETAGRVADLGGTIFVPPGDIPNIGRFSVAADPTGAMFGIFRG